MDIRANIDKAITLRPLRRVLIPTGIHIALPEHLEAQIRPRSGLAYKNGVTVLNAPGTIDSDFRGEIKALIINLSQEDFVINDGDRIAQMVIAPVTKIQWEQVLDLDETKRGEGGFGSTGVQ
ncbi:deoxyuridine 5'-triphosphate nucleotidohydrolase [Lausannevirus]|uniref:dUTP diphosphatase n=1 Tax=Lausannevirus TaxID=999883 RepID=F2WL28_9VIRU|nr:dUTPase [Lausannevirus]AEA06951.1 deoxyuridine 5'-triphosphate nucleotidohydrolase [Lausannevirus]